MERVRQLIGFNQENMLRYTGKGVYVAVLDSGVAMHPDLIDRIVAFRDFTDKHRGGTKSQTTWNLESVSYAYDDNGHGTHV